MIKKKLNQNDIYVQELIDTVEPKFIFSKDPINRFRVIKSDRKEKNPNKIDQLLSLKKQIDSIENCNLKKNSKNLVMGCGEIESNVMLIGEAPSEIEEETGKPFQGEVGSLLKKMLSAINLKIEKTYLTYAINFRPPYDRKPTSIEIKRYSVFLKEHISIVNPEIIILMGTTAMEAVTGLNKKISNERGKWKEIILNNRTVPLMITFSPSYLIRFPENKKYSWEDLKKIKQKIQDLNIKI